MPEQDRTEEPTQRRREESRRRGQVARSADLSATAVLLAFVAAASACALDFVNEIERLTHVRLAALGGRELSETAARDILSGMIWDVARLLAPLFALIATVIVLVNLAQTRFLVSTEVLAPQIERVSPASGLRRIFSMRGLVEALRTGLKATAIGWIAWTWVGGAVPALLGLATAQARDVLVTLLGLATSLAWRVALVSVIFGGADAIWQRHQHEQQLRMTRQEVRDEHRQNEGNPQVRSRRREMARRMSSARMLTMVPHADVVLTNPEHLAVALVYREAIMPAPRLLAKGGGDVARAIRDTARRLGIPVIENRPLARAIYHHTDVGREIPKDLYEPVAHVMAYILDLKEGVRS
jgi:flagellar biosynthetic protein FlhB